MIVDWASLAGCRSGEGFNCGLWYFVVGGAVVRSCGSESVKGSPNAPSSIRGFVESTNRQKQQWYETKSSIV
jgi:hypothetical protein